MQKSARLGKFLQSVVNLQKLQSRLLSKSLQNQIVRGSNGENIIKSPFGEVQYPEVSISDYIWKNCHLYPDKIATECGLTGRKYTYANLRDYSNYLGRSLQNIGVKRGDVVAMVAPNLPETPILMLGCLEAGFVLTTLNPNYTPDEVSRQLISSEAVAVITCTAMSSTVAAAMKTVKLKYPMIVIDDNTKLLPDGVIPFEDLITKGKTLPDIRDSECLQDELALLPYSSGTTGLPKGVMLTHRNIVCNIEMVKQSTSFDLWNIASESYQDILPAILPLYHIYGIATALSALSVGTKLITLPKFRPETFLSVLENNQATIFILVPPMVLFLSTSSMARRKHVERVQNILSAAAPLSGTDVEKFYNKFERNAENLRFCQGYGMTELSPISHFESTGTKYSSIGKTVAGSETRIVCPETKKDVHSFGQTGELWIRGPHVMKGYLNNEEATKETIRDGWLATGDIGYYDEDYDFYITDRIKELIKVKGYQVAPAELEALLRTHPEVLEAAVIGLPHPRYGEVPKAFVTVRNNEKVSEEDIQNFVKGKVIDFKELKGGVSFLDEIPRNPSGKILRKILKEKYC